MQVLLDRGVCIHISHLDNSHAFYKACDVDFNIGHGGKNDVRQPVKSQKHISKELPQEQRVDRFWGLVRKDERFRQQRTFSMVKKIVTENRTSLNNSALCSLLSCKINYTKPPLNYTPSKKTLRAAKSACHIYNTTKQ